MSDSPLTKDPLLPHVAEALAGSVKKWEEIVAGTRIEGGVDDCPLCQLFNKHANPAVEIQCEGCPIKAATGRKGCRGTPYEAYDDAFLEDDVIGMQRHAEAMHDFLKDLQRSYL